MVQRIFRFINKEILGLHQAAFLLGFFALSSQILALLRDRLLAHNFGAGIELDIYYAAFRIPDFIFISVASMVSVSILIPVLNEKLKEGKEKASFFLRQVFSSFFYLIIVISLIGFFLAPYILPFIFPGFSGVEQEHLTLLTRIMLLSPIILGLSNLLGSITQVYRRFFLYALSPVFYNLGIILGIILLAPSFGIVGVAIGVVVGAILHLSIHIPFVIQKGLFPVFTIHFDLAILKRVAGLSLPRTFTLSITHITIIALLAAASLMSEGSIAVFNFSFNLQSVPLSIIGVSYSLAAFTTLAKLFSEDKIKEFLRHITISAQHIIFWSIPVIILFIVLRAQIVRVVLGSGEFGWEATQLTAASLAIFSASVVFQGLVLLFVRAYYAMGKTLIPLVVNVISGGIVIASAFGFLRLFKSSEMFQFFIESLLRVEGVSGTEILMLPLGFTFGLFVNGFVLWMLLHRRFSGFSSSLAKTFSQSLSASIIAGGAAYISLNIYTLFIDPITFWTVLLQGAFATLMGIVVWAIILIGLNNREIKVVILTLKRKFWKAEVVGPDADLL